MVVFDYVMVFVVPLLPYLCSSTVHIPEDGWRWVGQQTEMFFLQFFFFSFQDLPKKCKKGDNRQSSSLRYRTQSEYTFQKVIFLPSLSLIQTFWSIHFDSGSCQKRKKIKRNEWVLFWHKLVWNEVSRSDTMDFFSFFLISNYYFNLLTKGK